MFYVSSRYAVAAFATLIPSLCLCHCSPFPPLPSAPQSLPPGQLQGRSESTDAWFFMLPERSADASKEVVQALNSTSGLPNPFNVVANSTKTGASKTQLFAIKITDKTPAVSQDSAFVINGTYNQALPNPALSFTPGKDNALYLGKNSKLHATSTHNNMNLTTVPLAFWLGDDTHPGSVLFGGYYDVHAISSATEWVAVFETLYGRSTFLSNGTQHMTSVTIVGPAGGKTWPAVIDMSHDYVDLPAGGANCNDKDATIAISGQLLPLMGRSGGDGCRVTAGSKIVLGKPFFEANYCYVSAEGAMFFAPVDTTSAAGAKNPQAWVEPQKFGVLDKQEAVCNWGARPMLLKDENSATSVLSRSRSGYVAAAVVWIAISAIFL